MLLHHHQFQLSSFRAPCVSDEEVQSLPLVSAGLIPFPPPHPLNNLDCKY